MSADMLHVFGNIMFMKNVYRVFVFGVILSFNKIKCNPITNSNFNKQIREFTTKEDTIVSIIFCFHRFCYLHIDLARSFTERFRELFKENYYR